MATGGTPFDDSAEELHNWTVTNGSLEDRLNNMVRAGQNLIEDKWLIVSGASQHDLLSLYNKFHRNFVIQTVKYTLLCEMYLFTIMAYWCHDMSDMNVIHDMHLSI